MNQIKRVVVGLVTAAIMAAGAVALADTRSEAIAERLKPVGEICMAGEECTGAASMVVAAGDSRDPAEIYQTKCFSCHNTGVGGAPKPGDKEAWAPRLEKGMDTLYKNAWEGINAMPPKGICMDCSEQEIRATVDYMLEQGS